MTHKREGSSVNRGEARKRSYTRAQAVNVANREANEQAHKTNVHELERQAHPATHVEERAHTKRVFIKPGKGSKSAGRYETQVFYTKHAERPSKALRRLRRAELRAGIDSTGRGTHPAVENTLNNK